MPSICISQFYLDKVLAQVADSKRFYVDVRQAVEEMHGMPPGYKGFDSDTIIL